jgi:hypothetical protein
MWKRWRKRWIKAREGGGKDGESAEQRQMKGKEEEEEVEKM